MSSFCMFFLFLWWPWLRRRSSKSSRLHIYGFLLSSNILNTTLTFQAETTRWLKDRVPMCSQRQSGAVDKINVQNWHRQPCTSKAADLVHWPAFGRIESVSFRRRGFLPGTPVSPYFELLGTQILSHPNKIPRYRDTKIPRYRARYRKFTYVVRCKVSSCPYQPSKWNGNP
jgi:hypothetical protein